MPLNLDFLDVDIKYGQEESVDLDVLSKTMQIPAVPNPSEYCTKYFTPKYDERDNLLHLNKGTTTLAFIFQGGILVSVDSRATQGPYIASQSVKKIIEINPYILATMAGGAADCQYFERDLTIQCNLFELKNKERISATAVSKLFHNVVYYYKGYGLSIGAMIAGWDPTGPALFYIDSDGSRLKAHPECPYFSVGSGSPYAYGILDTQYRFDMTVEEAVDLGQKAIYFATYSDSASGGMNNVYLVKEDGWTKICSEDVKDLHERYKK